MFHPGRVAILSIVACVVAFHAAVAHDLWLIPPARVEVNKPALILANSGMDFPRSEHAPDPAALRRRVLILPDGSEGTLAPVGTDEKSGLLQFAPTRQGIHIAAVETNPKLITLAASEFNAYLIADGLPHIYLLRSKEKTLDLPGNERYSKSPKALVQVGNGGGDPCRVIGLPLEIVPLRDPFALKKGDTLSVRVLFHDKPLSDANLGWDVPDDGEAPSGTVRTDAKGEALIPIRQTGLMTIRLTHMTRPKMPDYEWESFWTTLTFRIPE